VQINGNGEVRVREQAWWWEKEREMRWGSKVVGEGRGKANGVEKTRALT